MLEKKFKEQIIFKIKNINKEKNLEKRLEMMIVEKEQARNILNDFLDDLFAEVILTPENKKVNFIEFEN